MAVPYRAKDVAAEKTEFGHPETGLLLTTLHYYHAGLSHDQLRTAFECLARKGPSEAHATYAAWAQGAPELKVRSWAGINLDDSEQFLNLIVPALRRHMQVIDYWLDQAVFLSEARQYPQKLVSTAWDLCRGEIPCITTGFSGTDDAHLLLPLTICQDNMQELKATNGALLHNLIRQENDRYFALAAGATGRQLLEHVSRDQSIDVLLDPGALVLEISNRIVAQLWLEARKDRKAAVYFQGNHIYVVDRLGHSMPLAVSPFENSLNDCLLYLDDEHTRGADFQLPIGRRAVVTLGKGMQKDKLMQAVMRMRQLGNGHAVSFVASFEADLQIRDWRVAIAFNCENHYNLAHLPAILSWCLSNTVSWTCDKLLYLAAQGISQLRKRHAYMSHVGQPVTMAASCAETEVLTLEELYGHSSHTEMLPGVVRKLLGGTLSSLTGGQHTAIVDMAALIEEHIQRIASEVPRSTGISDEEHERELEEELEEERELDVERPRIVSPCVPQMSKGLIEFARSGRIRQQFLSFAHVLQETTFGADARDTWDKAVQVTPDFVDTVSDAGNKDYFLRPVTWMLVAKDGTTVLVSNFEAEQLASYFFGREDNTSLCLVAPSVCPTQRAALPSVPNHIAPPIAVQIFAGSVHGDADFLRDVHSFLGICGRQPSSPLWRELFEQRNAIESDGFVLPDFRAEVANALGVQIDSSFTSSPIRLLRRLYSARHLNDLLQTSPIGQLICASDMSRLTQSPRSPKSPKAPAAKKLPAKQAAVNTVLTAGKQLVTKTKQLVTKTPKRTLRKEPLSGDALRNLLAYTSSGL
jgi:hypothetical protein